MHDTSTFILDIFINDEKKSLTLNKDYSLAWVIFYLQASILQIPSTKEYRAPLWILVNNNKVVNAEEASCLLFRNSSLLTIQHAMKSKYFQLIISTLKEFGIVLTVTNMALLVFSMHTWILQKETENIPERIFFMLLHYPNYITQPTTIKRCYTHIQKNIEEFHKAFEEYLHKKNNGNE